MKNITVSVDEETYRLAQDIAAKYGNLVSDMLGEYLQNLTAGTKDSPSATEKTLSEIIAEKRAKGGGIDPSYNLTREELHDRNAFR